MRTLWQREHRNSWRVALPAIRTKRTFLVYQEMSRIYLRIRLRFSFCEIGKDSILWVSGSSRSQKATKVEPLWISKKSRLRLAPLFDQPARGRPILASPTGTQGVSALRLGSPGDLTSRDSKTSRRCRGRNPPPSDTLKIILFSVWLD